MAEIVNPDLLAAQNQTVAAINELTLAIAALGSFVQPVQAINDLKTQTVQAINDLQTEVNQMQIVINNQPASSNCCCEGGSAFFGSGSGAGSSIDDPGYTQPTSPSVPPGFDDETNYNEYKCKAANAMTLGIAEALLVFSDEAGKDYGTTVQEETAQKIYNWYDGKRNYLDSLTNGYLYSAEGALSESIWQWQANTLAWLWHFGSDQEAFNIFSEVRLLLLIDRENFVCGLYEAATTTEARNSIQTLVDGYISGLTYDSEVKQNAGSLIVDSLTNTYLNKLWTKDTNFDGYSDATAIDCGADCASSLCGTVTPCDIFILSGVKAPSDCVYTAASNGASWYYLGVYWNASGTTYADRCGDNVKITISELTGFNERGATPSAWYNANAGSYDQHSQEPYDGFNFCGQVIAFHSTTPFTVRLAVDNC